MYKQHDINVQPEMRTYVMILCMCGAVRRLNAAVLCAEEKTIAAKILIE